MATSYLTYKNFYERMAFDLRDKFESYDTGENDNSKILPYVEGMWVTSETINEVLLLNPEKRKRVRTYTFDDDTKTWTIPEYVGVLYGIRPENASIWETIGDSSVSDAQYVKISENQILNTATAGWVKGDTIEIDALFFPDDIIDEADPVEFPKEHLQFLRYEILIKMFSRKEKEIPAAALRKHAELKDRWVRGLGRIATKKQYPFRGYGMGR